MKENKTSFFFNVSGLSGVKLIVFDKCHGILEAAREAFPEIKFQRCIAHFYPDRFVVLKPQENDNKSPESADKFDHDP